MPTQSKYFSFNSDNKFYIQFLLFLFSEVFKYILHWSVQIVIVDLDFTTGKIFIYKLHINYMCF